MSPVEAHYRFSESCPSFERHSTPCCRMTLTISIAVNWRADVKSFNTNLEIAGFDDLLCQKRSERSLDQPEERRREVCWTWLICHVPEDLRGKTCASFI